MRLKADRWDCEDDLFYRIVYNLECVAVAVDSALDDRPRRLYGIKIYRCCCCRYICGRTD